MLRKTLLLLTLAPSVSLLQSFGAAADLPPASQWIDPDAVLVLEISQPAALLDPLLSPDTAKAVSAWSARQKPNLKLQHLQGVVAYLETQLGTDWRTGLRQLAGRGLTFSVGPAGGTLLAVDALDESMLKQLHEIFRAFAAAEAAKQNQPERVASRGYRGATAWTLGPNETHVLLGPRLLLANRPQLLDHALDLRAEPNGKSLASSPLYQAARQAVGKETVATAYLNMQSLRLLPRVKKALADAGNPLATLLLGDTKDALRNANWLAAGVYVKDGKLTLKTFTDGRAPDSVKSASFISPRGSEEGILPNLSVPGAIASFSLYRDLHSFYAAKDDLFPERTSGLVFFENMMGIFFSGIELTDGVLAEVKPDIRVVVATQQYEPAIGTPAVQVPAFAAVLRLRHPQAFGDIVEEAWQKALGLANFTRGQKALPGLIIDRNSHADVKYTLSYYRPPTDKDKTTIDSRYNYRPSLARPGDYLIFSSTDGLARDLIDALQKESASPLQPSPAAHSRAEIDGAHLRAILLANREALVRKNMVDKGNSRERAENEIGSLLTVLDCLDRATLSLSKENGHPQAELELKLKLPNPNRPESAAVEKPESPTSDFNHETHARNNQSARSARGS